MMMMMKTNHLVLALAAAIFVSVVVLVVEMVPHSPFLLVRNRAEVGFRWLVHSSGFAISSVVDSSRMRQVEPFASVVSIPLLSLLALDAMGVVLYLARLNDLPISFCRHVFEMDLD